MRSRFSRSSRSSSSFCRAAFRSAVASSLAQFLHLQPSWQMPPAAKRPKAAPSAAQLQQAEALEELRGELREAELKIDGLAAKSAQQERLIAHLERFNALVLEENEELRRLLVPVSYTHLTLPTNREV